VQVGVLLARAARQLGSDLILCGERSVSGMHGAVGAAIARFLGVPLLRGIVKLELSSGSAKVLATQKFEKGDRWLWECPLPVVCTLDASINIPRYVPVHRQVLARHTVVPELALEDATNVADVFLRRYGRLDLVKIKLPRVRPKRTDTLPASLSPAERLKAIRSGGVRERKERQGLKGDPLSVSRQIMEFLADKGFI
jgi:electron transfer flavoprotein beta subunit